MASAAKIASWLMLAASLPLIGDTPPEEDPEAELEESVKSLEEAIRAFVELEGGFIVESAAPVIESFGPLVKTLPIVITDAVNAAGIALQLGRLGIESSAPTDEGFQIYYIHPKSSAAQSGLQPQDIIVSINGTTVEAILSDSEQVQVLASSVEEGDEPILLVAVRDGEELEVEVENKTLPTSFYLTSENLPGLTIGSPEHGYVMPVTRSRDIRKQISVLEIEEEIGYYFGVEFGVLVVDTPKGHDQLKPGDIVLRFNDNPIRSYSHLKKYSAEVDSSASVKIRIKRRGRTMNVDFSPKKWRLAQVYEYK